MKELCDKFDGCLESAAEGKQRLVDHENAFLGLQVGIHQEINQIRLQMNDAYREAKTAHERVSKIQEETRLLKATCRRNALADYEKRRKHESVACSIDSRYGEKLMERLRRPIPESESERRLREKWHTFAEFFIDLEAALRDILDRVDISIAEIRQNFTVEKTAIDTTLVPLMNAARRNLQNTIHFARNARDQCDEDIEQALRLCEEAVRKVKAAQETREKLPSDNFLDSTTC